MGTARAVYERFRTLIHEFAGFGVFGIIGVVITDAGYAYFDSHGFGSVTATTFATIIAAIVTYVGNRYVSFRHRQRSTVLRETVIFAVLNVIGLLIQDACVAFNSYVLGLEHNKLAEFLALNCGIGVATLFRFWSYRKFVWMAHPGGEAGAGSAGQPGTPPAGAGSSGNAPVGAAHANGHSRSEMNGHSRPGATAGASVQLED